MKKINESKNKSSWPTVGDLIEYIYKHNIPMDTEILVERVPDFYMEEGKWEHYVSHDDHGDTELLNVHNGFGFADDGKFLVLWMFH